MIIRILGEGQWTVKEDRLDDLQSSDAKVERAVAENDQDELSEALAGLIDHIKEVGLPVPDDVLADSDLIIPDAGSTVDEVRQYLDEIGSGEGLIFS